MTEYERLQKQNFTPKFKKGDVIQTKSHIKYYRKHKIEAVGAILYLLSSGGRIYFSNEADWELVAK